MAFVESVIHQPQHVAMSGGQNPVLRLNRSPAVAHGLGTGGGNSLWDADPNTFVPGTIGHKLIKFIQQPKVVK